MFAGPPEADGRASPARGSAIVELAGRAEVDVLDGGAGLAQLGGPHPGLEPPGVPTGDLAVDQQAEPFGVGEIADGILRLQLGEG